MSCRAVRVEVERVTVGEGMLARRAGGMVGVEAPLLQGLRAGLAARERRESPLAVELLGRRRPETVTAEPQ